MRAVLYLNCLFIDIFTVYLYLYKESFVRIWLFTLQLTLACLPLCLPVSLLLSLLAFFLKKYVLFTSTGQTDERPLEFESAPENGKKKFFFDQMKTIRRIQFWFVFAKSETLDIFSRFGLGKCQDKMDSVDFAAFLSHPTGDGLVETDQEVSGANRCLAE